MDLVLRPEDAERLIAFSRQALPEEACGLLLGRHAAGCTRVEAVVRTRNVAEARRQDLYEVHPEDYLAADRAAREHGLEIVGVWHSHPDSPARPSGTDLQRAYPGWSYAIVGQAAGARPELCSWRLEEDQFLEERVGMAADPLATPSPSTAVQSTRGISVLLDGRP